MSHHVDGDRVKKLNQAEYQSGCVCYWMNRDGRAEDNWALLFAQQKALEHNTPLIVVYNLDPGFLGGGYRQHAFKIKGLQEVEQDLKMKRIPFFVVSGDDTEKQLLDFFKKKKVGLLVTDFSPLRLPRKWSATIRESVEIPFYGVDAHNIVPIWSASDKKEFAAHTIRPKINKQLGNFLTPIPSLLRHEVVYQEEVPSIPWDEYLKDTRVDQSVKEADWIEPGGRAARKVLKYFIQHKLEGYSLKRNDPNKDGLSNMSPYLHYGQIAPQRVALEVERAHVPSDDKEAFLEELIVRRELSDNFCFYEPKYDQFEGFHEWAQKTLNEHRNDTREYIYIQKQFEEANTHDDLWNAAQKEMVDTGKMHGYMRMYWAKKILEWTTSPEDALEIAIYLNDKYELDGRDPNGYVGVAWSIGGVHDRAWGERDVFGKIRYMNYEGCKRKFDVEKYIERFLEKNPEPKTLDL